MEWQSPQFLYLLLPLCVGWLVLALYSERKRQRAREAFVAQPMWSRVLPASSRTRFWIKLILRQLAIVSGLLALAGPRFGTQLEQVVPRGSDLYVLVDVSRSMLADDVPPSRLERAKADVSALVNRLEGERVGLIAFAGQAVVKCPLTVDYDSFRRALNELDPDSAPRGGTAIGDAIRKAIEVFDADAERDQAVLLITDGDDQESYPLEAATIAAERNVTVFTVGLGDADKGSRVPQKSGAAAFVEHDGQQVWSKLDGKLLQNIALKTSGVYVPAGTRTYDLGELYAAHLQGRKGGAAGIQQRLRKSERFQVFLAISLLALLTDLCVSPYMSSDLRGSNHIHTANNASQSSRSAKMVASSLLSLVMMSEPSGNVLAGEEYSKIREGINLYKQEQYEEAGKAFAAAGEELDKLKSAKAAVAAFDEACSHHKKGDFEKARDRYLKAGLSQDRLIATASHFNLGTMSAEHAHKLAGERPENVPADKRQEILNELKQAIASYRHCLELEPNHAQSRRNLELVRTWIKYYSDRWREQDRQKLRDESNLIEFLEFLMQTQSAIQETVRQLPENVTADAFAEIKRAQDELREEVPTLREKISTELLPKEPQTGAATQAVPKEVQDGITLLQGWADEASKRMENASQRLSNADRLEASSNQQAAFEELDRIWDAVIPFQPLLAKELSDQTTIARTLRPETKSPVSGASDTPNSLNESLVDNEDAIKIEPETEPEPPVTSVDPAPVPLPQTLTVADESLVQLAESQTKTLLKTRLLAPKAEAELSRVELQPDPQAAAPSTTEPPTDPAVEAIDPEQVKAGLRKAIELAPKAVESMEAAVEQLRKKDSAAAGIHAEEARRILEEIQQSQPKNDPQDKDQQDQEKNQQDKQENKEQEKDNQEKESEDPTKQEEKQPDDKESDHKEDGQKDDKQTPEKKSEPQQVSQDRIEEALRKVRERQQEKRERDQETRMRIIGRSPVDKDW